MKKLLSMVLDILFFVVGPIIAVIGIFSFNSGTVPLRSGPIYTCWYYYPDNAIVGIGIGVGLICFGFLLKYWRRQK